MVRSASVCAPRSATLAQRQQFHAIAGNVANAQHGATGDGAAFGLEMAAGHADQRHAETLRRATWALDALVETLGGGRFEPGAEAEHATRHGRIGDEPISPSMSGSAFCRAPGDDDLRLRGQEQMRAFEFGAGDSSSPTREFSRCVHCLRPARCSRAVMVEKIVRPTTSETPRTFGSWMGAAAMSPTPAGAGEPARTAMRRNGMAEPGQTSDPIIRQVAAAAP